MLFSLSKKPVTVKIRMTRERIRYRIKVSFHVILSEREGSSHLGREGFFVTALLRMTYKERFCCNHACFARILTSIATRALPYLCTPTVASCSASGTFLQSASVPKRVFRHAEPSESRRLFDLFEKLRQYFLL